MHAVEAYLREMSHMALTLETLGSEEMVGGAITSGRNVSVSPGPCLLDSRGRLDWARYLGEA